MLDVAVIGVRAGNPTTYLRAPRALDRTRLRWVVDPDRELARSAAARVGNVGFATDPAAVHAATDVAIVAAPIASRDGIIRALLEADIPVFAASPVATSAAAARDLVALADGNGIAFGVARPLRASPTGRALAFLRDQRAVGPIEAVSVRYGGMDPSSLAGERRLRPAERWGGVFAHDGIHALDLLAWLFGQDIALTTYRDDASGGIEANAEAAWRTEATGIEAALAVTATRQVDHVLHIEGREGSLEADLDTGRIDIERTTGRTIRLWAGETEAFPANVAAAFGRFVCAIEGEPSGGVRATDEIHLVDFIETCYANREPLEYPWEGRPTTSDRAEVRHVR